MKHRVRRGKLIPSHSDPCSRCNLPNPFLTTVKATTGYGSKYISGGTELRHVVDAFGRPTGEIEEVEVMKKIGFPITSKIKICSKCLKATDEVVFSPEVTIGKTAIPSRDFSTNNGMTERDTPKLPVYKSILGTKTRLRDPEQVDPRWMKGAKVRRPDSPDPDIEEYQDDEKVPAKGTGAKIIGSTNLYGEKRFK